MRWAGHVACVGGMEISCKTSFGKPLGTR